MRSLRSSLTAAVGADSRERGDTPCCSSGTTGPRAHHDVEIIDEDGKVLARKRLPEGLAGITQLHELIAHHLGEPVGDPAAWPPVVVGIETDRGAWVASLVAAGYEVFAINPRMASRYRDRHSESA